MKFSIKIQCCHQRHLMCIWFLGQTFYQPYCICNNNHMAMTYYRWRIDIHDISVWFFVYDSHVIKSTSMTFQYIKPWNFIVWFFVVYDHHAIILRSMTYHSLMLRIWNEMWWNRHPWCFIVWFFVVYDYHAIIYRSMTYHSLMLPIYIWFSCGEIDIHYVSLYNWSYMILIW